MIDALRKRTSQTRLSLIALVGALAIVVVLPTEAAWAHESSPPGRPPADRSRRAAAPTSPGHPSALTSDTTQDTAPVLPPQFTLYGVVVAGETRSAFVVEPHLTDGFVQRFVEGQRIGPHLLRRVESDRVAIEVRAPGKQPITLTVLLGSSVTARPDSPAATPSTPIASREPLPSAETVEQDDQRFDRLSREFGVSAAVLQVQRGQRGLRDWSGLIIGYILSRETGLSVEQLATEYQSGKDWAQIAREHGVGLSGLNRELSELRARLEVGLTALSSR